MSFVSNEEMKKENDTIFKELVQNGYHRKLVKTTIPEPTRENPETPRQYVETPYIKGASEGVGKLLKNHNILSYPTSQVTLSETSSVI